MLTRVLKLIISVFFFILQETVLLIQRMFKEKISNSLVILSYHSVKAHQRKKFAKQMDHILKFGKPVFPDLKIAGKRGLHYISVTFDDGFCNVVENALPEMFVRNIPATLFIVTKYLGSTPDWILDPNHENANELLITADQLKSLSRKRVQIGSHCVTHPRLTLLDTDEIKSELKESKEHLEKLLSRHIKMLAFPYDDYNEKVVSLAKEAGYSYVLKDTPTFPISKTNSFLIGRINISPEDLNLECFLKIKGAYQWLPIAIGVKKLLFKTILFPI